MACFYLISLLAVTVQAFAQEAEGRGLLKKKLCKITGNCQQGFGGGGYQQGYGGHQGGYGGYQGGYGGNPGYPPINIAVSQSQAAANGAEGGYSTGYYPQNYQTNNGFGGGYGGYQGRPGGYFGNGQGAYNSQFNGNYFGGFPQGGGGYPQGGGGYPQGGFGFQGPFGNVFNDEEGGGSHRPEYDDQSDNHNNDHYDQGVYNHQGGYNQGNNIAGASSSAFAGRKYH